MRRPSISRRRGWLLAVVLTAIAAVVWARTGPAAEPAVTTAPAAESPAPAPTPPPTPLLTLPPAAPPAAAPAVPAAAIAPQPATRPAWGPRAALRPYTAFSWSAVGPMRHVSPFTWATPDSTPAVVARSVNNRSDGCHVLFSWQLTDPLLGQQDDRCRTPDGRWTSQPGIWPDRGVEVVARRLDDFLGQYAKAGGKCDLLVLDDERNFSTWAMAPEAVVAVEQDPRFADVRGALGFADVARTVNAGWQAHPAEVMRWNAHAYGWMSAALNRAAGIPLARHFPGAWMSNFGAVVMPPENVVPDVNGVPQYTAGEPFGNCQSPVVYGSVGDIRARVPGPDWRSPFTAVLWTTNHVRSAARSSPLPVLPWVAYRSWAGDHPESPTVPWVNTDYWQEAVYHAVLSGGTANVLFFNPPTPTKPGQKPPPGSFTYADAEAMDAVMAELEKQAGGSPPAKPLTTTAADYRAKVLVSAARTAAGRTVARVTFADGLNTAEVTVDGRAYHVTRPEGKVGMWIVAP